MNINIFMNNALEIGKNALLVDEVPVGAILVDNFTKQIISSSHNLVNTNLNATLHAEILIINEACKIRNTKFLNDTSIFVTLEPCAMCAAAISEVRIKRVYFGAYDEKKGAMESIMNIYSNKNYYVPEVYGGICEKECSSLISNFFKNKRVI